MHPDVVADVDHRRDLVLGFVAEKGVAEQGFEPLEEPRATDATDQNSNFHNMRA